MGQFTRRGFHWNRLPVYVSILAPTNVHSCHPPSPVRKSRLEPDASVLHHLVRDSTCPCLLYIFDTDSHHMVPAYSLARADELEQPPAAMDRHQNDHEAPLLEPPGVEGKPFDVQGGISTGSFDQFLNPYYLLELWSVSGVPEALELCLDLGAVGEAVLLWETDGWLWSRQRDMETNHYPRSSSPYSSSNRPHIHHCYRIHASQGSSGLPRWTGICG